MSICVYTHNVSLCLPNCKTSYLLCVLSWAYEHVAVRPCGRTWFSLRRSATPRTPYTTPIKEFRANFHESNHSDSPKCPRISVLSIHSWVHCIHSSVLLKQVRPTTRRSLNLQVFLTSPAIPQQLNEPIDEEQRKSSSSPEWFQRAKMGTRVFGSKVP